jgi:hypothetical protein
LHFYCRTASEIGSPLIQRSSAVCESDTIITFVMLALNLISWLSARVIEVFTRLLEEMF